MKFPIELSIAGTITECEVYHNGKACTKITAGPWNLDCSDLDEDDQALVDHEVGEAITAFNKTYMTDHEQLAVMRIFDMYHGYEITGKVANAALWGIGMATNQLTESYELSFLRDNIEMQEQIEFNKRSEQREAEMAAQAADYREMGL